MSYWRSLPIWLCAAAAAALVCAAAAAAQEWTATSRGDRAEIAAARPVAEAESTSAIQSPHPVGPAESADTPPVGPALDAPANSSASPHPELPTQPLPATPIAPDIVFDDASQNWSHDVLAGEALIWRELRSSTEILPGDGATFGMTTLVFGSLVSSNGGLAASLQEGAGDPQFWVAPRFGWHFLSGPRAPDLPPQLYTLNLEFGFAAPINESTTAHLQIAPTWTTDFHTSGGEAFRVIAGGLVTHRLSSEWLLAAGGLYLDRPDLPALPLGGVRWSPGERFELDLMVPRPRAAFRIRRHGTSRDASWLYVGGDLGGGSWAFERPGGFDDRVGYRDLRLVGGIEWRESDGLRAAFEAGYVFDRRLDFDRGPGDQDLPGTAVVRMGANY